MELSNVCVMLPMKGMVQSLNLSTAAAIFLAEIMRQRSVRSSKDPNHDNKCYEFDESEREAILDKILVNDFVRRKKIQIFGDEDNDNGNVGESDGIGGKKRMDYWEKRATMR
eukprot:jgi/Bigna1/138245/aug1.43_g12953